MGKRFVSVFFHHLMTDWFARRQPELLLVPFVVATPDHGRLVITHTNRLAEEQGITEGLVVAEARVIVPSLQIINDIPGVTEKLLKRLAEWSIRFAPYTAIDLPAGLILDASGCAHLWGSDDAYLKDMVRRFHERGYQVRVGMADTIGAAWAIARYGKGSPVGELNDLLSLPTAALRIERELADRLYKLGIRDIKNLIVIPRPALRRRFGKIILQRLDQAFGREEEFILPVQETVPYQERLPCLEPIVTLTGIEIALQKLLDTICHRLQQEGKGLRSVSLLGYRIDGKIVKAEIGTNRPSSDAVHLYKLFGNKLSEIEPAPGIELFVLEARKVQDYNPLQKKLWEKNGGLNDPALSQLLDRLAGKFGEVSIRRYLPDEHYWPERSYKQATTLEEQRSTSWSTGRRRPVQVFSQPEPIDVTAPIPDYPPMLFRYKGVLHKIVKADGPERIEQEWWLQQGRHRDYYCVEDENGYRFWIFRSGHYDEAKSYRWYIHGFFA